MRLVRTGIGRVAERHCKRGAERKGCRPEGQRYINSNWWSGRVEFSVCAQHHRSTVADLICVSLLVGGTGLGAAEPSVGPARRHG